MTWRLGIGLSILRLVASASEAVFDPLQYVNPLTGSAGGGHAFAGATLPYGMVKAVADTDSGEAQAGFVSDDHTVNVTGFSGMHDSGTGGSLSLGNFPLFAHPFCAGGIPSNCQFSKANRKTGYINDSVVAEPGFFGLTLDTGIRVEMTTTQHTALYNFSFPISNTTTSGNDDDAAAAPLILVDLTDLSDSRQDGAEISVNAQDKTIKGSATFKPSFGAGTYKLYFCAAFLGADTLDAGIFVNTQATSKTTNLTMLRGINQYPLPGGAWIRFKNMKDNSIIARVGLSFKSTEQACTSSANEIPDWNFAAVRASAHSLWKDKLSGIEVSREGGPNEDYIRAFYSGIYRTMISPQNYTGENPIWESSEPYFDSFYCIWDGFRSQLPFLTLIDPKTVTQMVRSLIDTYRHDGYLPDCRMTFNRGYTQGGSNADIVLADAYLKGIREGIDWNTGYEAIVKDAEIEPADWCCHGRGGLDSWHELGYIPRQDLDFKGVGPMTRSISRTLEYAYNDYAAYQLGAGLTKSGSSLAQDPIRYLNRSANWNNLFKPDAISTLPRNSSNTTTFVGFFQPKFPNATWSYQDPLSCSPRDPNPNTVCSLQGNALETFESSIWEYSFFVPHNQASLIAALGGDTAFVKRLDYMHDQGLVDPGNEPSFLTLFQYHYAGRPGLSAKRVHFYIPAFFNASALGLPGNDDSGAMGSFMAFCMMGLFPNPGQDVYLITPPFFKKISLTSPLTGAIARISVQNFDPAYANLYIQNASLDGQMYTRNWLDHSFLANGGELVLTLGPVESETWGRRVEDRPPSVGPYLGEAGIGFGDGLKNSWNGTLTRDRETLARVVI